MGYALGKVRVGVMAFILFFNPQRAIYSTALHSLSAGLRKCVQENQEQPLFPASYPKPERVKAAPFHFPRGGQHFLRCVIYWDYSFYFIDHPSWECSFYLWQLIGTTVVSQCNNPCIKSDMGTSLKHYYTEFSSITGRPVLNLTQGT